MGLGMDWYGNMVCSEKKVFVWVKLAFGVPSEYMQGDKRVGWGWYLDVTKGDMVVYDRSEEA